MQVLMANYKKTSFEDFWDRVQKTDTCWLWTGPTKGGYGRYCVANATRVRAHVFVLTHFEGIDIPSGMQVNHQCRVKNCVNPDHLYIGTKSDNAIDWWEDRFRREIATHVKF